MARQADELAGIPQLQHDAVCTGGRWRCRSMVRTAADHTIEVFATPAGFKPADLNSAYALDATRQPTSTIAIVDAFNYPNAASDLAAYRSQFGLPPCTVASGCLKIVNQNGAASPLPGNAPPNDDWTVEAALDLDMASVACQTCKLVLVEAQDDQGNGLFVAQNAAAAIPGVVAISNSWGGASDGTDVSEDSQFFNHPNVSIFVASGDNGNTGSSPDYPSTSAHVTGVGGTSLVKSTSNARGWTESAWNGAGSSCSHLINKPAFQTLAVPTAACGKRAAADISAVADPNTGVAVYNAAAGGFLVIGGTSAASPFVAGVYARYGLGGHGPEYSYANSNQFFDVTTGSNGTCGTALCKAAGGWDGPTGNGSPNGAALAPQPSVPDPVALAADEKVDLNGDGKADVCGRSNDGVDCALSTGTGFGTMRVWSGFFSDAGGWGAGPQYYSTIKFPDLNGDGKADVCGRANDGVDCALSNGSGFGQATVWSGFFGDAGGWSLGPQYYSTISFPDLNGDGKADVCGRASDGLHCALSTGTAFGPVSLWTGFFSDAGGFSPPQYYSTISFPDLNGDGKADVCGRANDGIDCALSTGTGFGPMRVWSGFFGDAGGWAAGPQYYSTIRFPDLNGDGKADVCGRANDGVDCALSNGTGFGTISVWAGFFSDAGGFSPPQYYSTIRFPDLNGDGKADVCGRANDGVDCALSTGGAFGTIHVWSGFFSDALGWSAGPQYYSTIRFPDVNGDGKADVCGRANDGADCAPSTGTNFGQISVWSGFFSDAGGWAAGPQYFSTIHFP